MILVTGSAGFIGHYVSKALLELGYDVIGIDSMNDYYDVSLKEERNRLLSSYDNYRFVHGSITDREILESLFRQNDITLVCNLAAQAGVRYSIENPYAYSMSNLVGFLNILECCRNFNIGRLVYASSSSVFGGNKKVPFSEDDKVDNPVSLYAATKKANELMAHSYSHLYGLQTIGLRFFTVYGPMGRPDMAYFKFVKKILDGDSIDVYNNGDMRRDFTYIDDIVKGVVSAMFENNLTQYEVFNLGNHRSENLLDFIKVIESSLGVEAVKNFMPMQAGDVYETYADISKAQEKLGYSPQTPISKGIPQFVEWYKEFYNTTVQDKI